MLSIHVSSSLCNSVCDSQLPSPFFSSSSSSLSSTISSTLSLLFLTQFVPNDDFNQILLKCVQEISQHLRVALAPPNNPHVGMMRSLLEITMQLRIAQNYANVVMLLQKVSSVLHVPCSYTCITFLLCCATVTGGTVGGYEPSTQ